MSHINSIHAYSVHRHRCPVGLVFHLILPLFLGCVSSDRNIGDYSHQLRLQREFIILVFYQPTKEYAEWVSDSTRIKQTSEQTWQTTQWPYENPNITHVKTDPLAGTVATSRQLCFKQTTRPLIMVVLWHLIFNSLAPQYFAFHIQLNLALTDCREPKNFIRFKLNYIIANIENKRKQVGGTNNWYLL